MNASLFLYVPQAITLILLIVAGIAETVATRQTGAATYAYVSLIKLLRSAHVPATALVMTFVCSTIELAPVPLAVAFLLAIALSVLVYGKTVILGNYGQVFWRVFLPTVIVVEPFLNLNVLPHPSTVASMEFSPVVLVLSIVISFGFRYIACQRTEQYLIDSNALNRLVYPV